MMVSTPAIHVPSGQMLYVVPVHDTIEWKKLADGSDDGAFEFAFDAEKCILDLRQTSQEQQGQQRHPIPQLQPYFEVWLVMYHIFTRHSDAHVVCLHFPGVRKLDIRQRALILAFVQGGDTDAAHMFCSRSVFFQVSLPPSGTYKGWLGTHVIESPYNDIHLSEHSQYPLRPSKPLGGTLVYSRYIPSLDKTFTMRALNIESDADTFAEWMNNDRVAKFWNMKGDKDKVHVPYLNALDVDKHVVTVIGSLDDEQFLYTELYYVAEDHLAPFADSAGLYDRGFHLLVGNEHLRGPHIVRAWLTSIVHCLFLHDRRTRYVFLEPRADNEKLIGYLLQHGFTKLKEFDFPHKRAALMRIERETFFKVGPAM
ncbi:acyl-CoA N-acyltransferase [Lipomyces tetrasporus]